MTKAIVAIAIVLAIIVGGLLTLLRSSRQGQPSQDVIDRAKVREQGIEAKERDGDA